MANRQRLTRLNGYLDDLDNFEEDLHCDDNRDRFPSNWSLSMVGSRREADKDRPVMRWAEAALHNHPALRDAGYDQQRAFFAGVFGGTVTGRHALSHIEGLFDGEGAGRWGFHDFSRWAADGSRRGLRRELVKIIEGGEHAQLNARLKVHGLSPLGGIDDVDDFLNRLDHRGSSWSSPELGSRSFTVQYASNREVLGMHLAAVSRAVTDLEPLL